MLSARTAGPPAPALRRLLALAPLDEACVEAVEAAMARARTTLRGGNLIAEGEPITRNLLLLEGWAGRIRVFEDGRLQIMSFVLPGDLIGNCVHRHPVSVSTVIAFTDLRFCSAPSGKLYPELSEAYAVSRALEEAYLLAHIARLGRLSADERLADLLLELLERLELCGLAANGSFDLPLTQNTLADATGLTVVHVNRMIRQLRMRDEVSWSGGVLRIANRSLLSERVGRRVPRVSLD